MRCLREQDGGDLFLFMILLHVLFYDIITQTQEPRQRQQTSDVTKYYDALATIEASRVAVVAEEQQGGERTKESRKKQNIILRRHNLRPETIRDRRREYSF